MKKLAILVLTATLLLQQAVHAQYAITINGNSDTIMTTVHPGDTVALGIALSSGSSTTSYDLSLVLNTANLGSLDASAITFPTLFDFPGKVLTASSSADLIRCTAANFTSGPVNGPATLVDNVILNAQRQGDVVITLRDNSTQGVKSLDTAIIHIINKYGTGVDITKAIVKAGKDRSHPSDSIIITGKLPTCPAEFDTTQDVTLRVSSQGGVLSDISSTFALTGNPFVKLSASKGLFRKLRYIKKSSNGIVIATIDLNKKTFALAAKKINLTGLKDSLTVDISFGDYQATGTADQTIINGKKGIPLILLQGQTDALSIQKAKVNKKGNALNITGAIALQNPNVDLTTIPVTLSWDQQDFTLPAGSFTNKKNNKKYITKSIKLKNDGPIIKAMIDIGKGTYKINIKESSNLTNTGSPVWRIRFDSFDQSATIPLP